MNQIEIQFKHFKFDNILNIRFTLSNKELCEIELDRQTKKKI